MNCSIADEGSMIFASMPALIKALISGFFIAEERFYSNGGRRLSLCEPLILIWRELQPDAAAALADFLL